MNVRKLVPALATLVVSSLFAQVPTPQPVVAHSGDSAARPTAALQQQHAELEAHIRARLRDATGETPAAAFKAIRTTASPGVVAAELECDWLRYHVRVTTDGQPQPGTYAGNSKSLDEVLDAFARVSVAPRVRIEETLHQLNLSFGDAYSPATSPYYNNGRGVVWVKHERRFVLIVRGVIDSTENRCFKAAIDTSTADVITQVTVQCSIQ
jgi:hypothetical protein